VAGVQGGASHVGILLASRADYDTAIATAPEFGVRLVSPCEHGGLVAHASIADPEGSVVEIQYGSGALPVATGTGDAQEGAPQ
jgi:predicted lactoylglutathione lyase